MGQWSSIFSLKRSRPAVSSEQKFLLNLYFGLKDLTVKWELIHILCHKHLFMQACRVTCQLDLCLHSFWHISGAARHARPDCCQFVGSFRSTFTLTMFMNASFCKTKKIWAMTKLKIQDHCPLNMVLSQRTTVEGTGYITLTAGYAWHFACDLQPRRSGQYLFIS